MKGILFGATVSAGFVMAAAYEHDKVDQTPWLDVGCGLGQTAWCLMDSGYPVIGIDANGESVARAREIGVDALHCRLSEFQHEPFSLIYLSRALHHMPPLTEAVEKLSALIKEDGILLIEDFDFQLFDERAAAWLREKKDEIESVAPIETERHGWLRNGHSIDEIRKNWIDHTGKHKISSGLEMREALSERFEFVSTATSANLFRYVEDLLPAGEHPGRTTLDFYKEENSLIAEDRLPAMGLRWVLKVR